ncbi:hypothetical protein [Lactococcus lactis]|uniref:hypothetical protein n=1 Tax=Lactococcus lactis TaxID=1358 RepID=UPI0012542F7B|nr:hypothetical protein [Lactococcus lactis]TYR29153.1 hypothetical protein FYK05_00775 [Lactococcus lactis subsp. lactis bv. diacetylactis]
MKYKFKGYHWVNQQGCLVFSEPKRVAVYTEDSFDSFEEAKAEWIKDPWLEDGDICILATEIIKGDWDWDR